MANQELALPKTFSIRLSRASDDKKQLSHDRGRDPGPFLELSKRVMSVRVKSCPCSAFGLGHRQADKADMTM